MGKMYDHRNKKIQLDDIRKESVYKVPSRYFVELPGIIQARIQKGPEITQHSRLPIFNWKIALVTATLLLTLVFYALFRGNSKAISPEEILAQVSIEDIIEYLDFSEITTEDILAELTMEEADIDEFLQNDIMFLNEEEIESIDILELYEKFGIKDDSLTEII